MSFPAPAPFHLQEMAPKKRRRWPLAVAAVGVLILAAVATYAVFLVLRPQSTTPASDPTAGLVAACHTAAEQQLKAPATARYSQESTRPGNNASQFYVDGVVDAENGFGAQVRQKYYCDATRTDSGWSARVTFGRWP